MSIPVVCPKQPLPRDLDVFISIERPITEIATDMTLICFVTPSHDFAPNNGRVRYYSTMQAVEADFAIGSEAWWAGNAFFSRQRRPLTMAIGGVFTDPVAAAIVTGNVNISGLQVITNGAFSLVINETLFSVSALDFSSITTLDDIVPILNTALTTAGAPVTVSLQYGGIAIITTTAGDGATISYAEANATGFDVSDYLGLTLASGAQLWQGYTPGNLASEIVMVDVASRCNQRPIYGWTIDRQYRDTADQIGVSDWAESKTPAYFSACTNSVTAYNTMDVTNVGYLAQYKGYKRTSTIYHHNPQVYPDVSYIAYALATNYNLPDSAITMKFKQLDGIEPTYLTETQLSALNSRNINSFTAIGNNTTTVREGVQGAATWFTDTLVNLDNFREDLQVEVYNVFLRTPKVPYTSAGQNKLVSAAAKICRKYTRNGVFAARDIEDETSETGFITRPATDIVPVNVAFSTTSDRAARLAPPIRIVAFESGSFHRVSISVDVFS